LREILEGERIENTASGIEMDYIKSYINQSPEGKRAAKRRIAVDPHFSPAALLTPGSLLSTWKQ
jgi:hypothetical protein